jgi:hypothetical protein
MNMNAKAHGWEIDEAVKEKSEELVHQAEDVASRIAGALQASGREFAKSQLRHLLAIMDRERNLAPVRLWMRYQDARSRRRDKGSDWQQTRPFLEDLLDYCTKSFPQDPEKGRHCARVGVGYLIQALLFETAKSGRQS